MNESDHGADQDLEAPPKLTAALKEASRREIFVPPEIDRAVVKAAQRHLCPPTTPWFSPFRRWMLWPALAGAAVLIACIGWFALTSWQWRYAREDLNHDGKVDILDAFALARKIESSQRLPAALDLNGDGVVDARDVALIAAHAVKLEKDNGS